MDFINNKITEIIKNCIYKNAFSIEVSPGLKIEELNKLEQKPLFYSVSWHAKSHMCKDFEIGPIQLADKLISTQNNVLIHISCDQLRKSYVDKLLQKLKEIKVQNVFIVQGDNFEPSSSDFKLAKDLVSYIREKCGNYFCIGVAGYPECDDQGLKYLKAKVDCGADFVITQAFFDAQIFLNFMERCRQADLTIPIIPGLFIFESTDQLSKFVKLCNLTLPENFLIYNNKSNDSAQLFRREDLRKIVKDIRDQNYINIHYFSVNKIRNVSDFVQEMNLTVPTVE